MGPRNREAGRGLEVDLIRFVCDYNFLMSIKFVNKLQKSKILNLFEIYRDLNNRSVVGPTEVNIFDKRKKSGAILILFQDFIAHIELLLRRLRNV